MRVGDVVKLKKEHPCGANEWKITRIGMDIGLECLGCGRKVRLVRYEFDRRFRVFLRRAADEQRGDAASAADEDAHATDGDEIVGG